MPRLLALLLILLLLPLATLRAEAPGPDFTRLAAGESGFAVEVVAEMLARERNARLARRGIWAHPYYAVRTPEQAENHVGSFQLVEGWVVDAAIVRRRGYINFGEDWKSDFTIAIKPKDHKQFGEDGADILRLKGRIVRVRGWIKSYNGAMIEATHPVQIEVFE